MKALVLACCLLVWVLPRGLAEDAVSAEARAGFDWFATLGYPEVKEARWAEVWTSTAGGNPKGGGMQAITSFGFVIHAEGDEYEIMNLSLRRYHGKKSGPEVKEYARSGFEERSLHEFAVLSLKELRDTQPGKSPSWHGLSGPLPVKSQLFVLAYACWRKGDVMMAQEAFDEAAKLPVLFGTYDRAKDGVAHMRSDLEQEIGDVALGRAMRLFAGDEFSTAFARTWEYPPPPLPARADVLKALREWVRLYPGSRNLEKGRHAAQVLERMLKEGETHPVMAEADLAKLPVQEQVKELIFQLRNQRSWEVGWRDECDIFGKEGPATKLVKLSHAAVPQLIEAFDDERFSRGLTYDGDQRVSHTPFTVGDCAKRILEKIAGRRFEDPRRDGVVRETPEERLGAKKVAQAWWSTFENASGK